MPKILKEKAAAKKLIEDSEHLDTTDNVQDPEYRRGGCDIVLEDTPALDSSDYFNDDDGDDPLLPEEKAQEVLPLYAASNPHFVQRSARFWQI